MGEGIVLLLIEKKNYISNLQLLFLKRCFESEEGLHSNLLFLLFHRYITSRVKIHWLICDPSILHCAPRSACFSTMLSTKSTRFYPRTVLDRIEISVGLPLDVRDRENTRDADPLFYPLGLTPVCQALRRREDNVRW